MSERLKTRAELEDWLRRDGREPWIEEPTVRVSVTLPGGKQAPLDLFWKGPKGLSLFIALPVVVAPRHAAAVDATLAELNAALDDAGFRRSGPGVVCGQHLYPNHDGTYATEVIAQAMAACRDAMAAGAARVAAAAGAQ